MMLKKCLLLVLFLSCPVFSAEIPATASLVDFSGGLNDTDASIYLQANESPDLSNVVIDEPANALTQRKGYVTCGNTLSGNTATAMAEYSKSNGSRSLIVSDNISVWTSINCVDFSTITTGLSSLDTPSFKTIRDKLWIVNGTTSPITWDGTTATYLDGTSDKPNPQKAKYVEFWKDRVWLARTGTEPSSLYFNELTDDDGTIIDPSVSSAAWTNALNTIYINREDGSPIYGLKQYRDNLYVFKETGIWRIIYESDLDITVVKAVSSVGCKFNDSIVEMDDSFLHFVGKDGVYVFDGVTARRESDKWQNTFNRFKQPYGQERYQLWDSVNDWAAGTFSNTNATYTDGSLGLSVSYTTTSLLDNFSDSNYTADPTWTVVTNYGGGILTASGQFLRFSGNPTPLNPAVRYLTTPNTFNPTTMAYGKWDIDLYFTATVPSFAYYDFVKSGSESTYDRYRLYVQPRISDTENSTTVRLYCNDSLLVAYANAGITTPSTYYTYSITRTTSNVFTGYRNGVVLFSTNTTGNPNLVDLSSSSYVGVEMEIYGNEIRVDNIKTRGYLSTGTYTSQVSTFSTLTQWRTFDVDKTLNGQSIIYKVRTATTPYNLELVEYSTITPGGIISASTSNINFQWKADLTTYDSGKTPLLNSAAANYREGDSSISRLSALSYKNRYWLSGSTTPANAYNDLVLVKSKTPILSWSPYNLGISAFAVWNGNLYGAISNTSNIARLDYGDNDGGAAINSHWTSKDEIYGVPYLYKKVNEVILHYSKSGNDSLVIGLSSDGGDSYTNRTVTLADSLYPHNTKRLFFEMPYALNYRTKISNSKLDYGYTVFGVHSFGLTSDFRGN